MPVCVCSDDLVVPSNRSSPRIVHSTVCNVRDLVTNARHRIGRRFDRQTLRACFRRRSAEGATQTIANGPFQVAKRISQRLLGSNGRHSGGHASPDRKT